MNNLVVAEHNQTTLSRASLSTITAAQACGESTDMLIAGYHCEAVVASARQLKGIRRILHCDAALYTHPLAENMAALITHVASDYTHILAPANTFGKNIMPRVAALLDVGQVSDIVDIMSPDTFVRPIYAGNALATVQSLDPVKVITVRPTAFDPIESHDTSALLGTIDALSDTGLSHFVGLAASGSARPDLDQAHVVVSGGRGLQKREHFQLIEQLADIFHGAVGASRAAVDADFVPNDYQVGQTGKVVAPALYIAIGISGAMQHIAGMKESKIIVAINQDESAPIFSVATFGIIGDLFDIVPAFIEALSS